MANAPYTTRLLGGRGPTGLYSIEVPVGYRAVVIHVTLAAWTVTGQSAFVFAAGDVIWHWPAPGANAVQSVPIHGVAYAGETVALSTNGADMGWHITGYLLRDDGSGPRPDAQYSLRTEEMAALELAILLADHALAGHS